MIQVPRRSGVSCWGRRGRMLCAMDYKILVLHSTDLSAASLTVAKSKIAEALPKTYFKVCLH